MTRLEYLLQMVADRPDGAKVDLAAIIRAFTPPLSQIVTQIERLIADGKLDPITLRRPPEPRAVAESDADARKANATTAAGPSGPELAADLEIFIAWHCLSRSAVCVRLFKSSGALALMRHTARPRAVTVEKVRAFLAAEPPAELKLKSKRDRAPKTNAPLGDRRYVINRTKSAEGASPRVETPAGRPANAKEAAPDDPNEARPPFNSGNGPRRDPTKAPPDPMAKISRSAAVKHAHQSRAIRKTSLKQAAERLDKGLRIGNTQSVHVKIAMRDLERQRADEDRLADPIEQAKTIIRRKGIVVFGAEVSGGRKGMFYVGQRLMSKRELLEYAGRIAA